MRQERGLAFTYGQLIVVAISWGGAFVAAKFVVSVAGLPPFTTATLRFAMAALLLMLVLGWREKVRPQLNLLDWTMAAGLGLTGIFGYNALFFTGLKYTSSISGSLIIAINPVVTILLSMLFLKERVKRLQGIGILTSFLGVVIVVTKGSLHTLISLQFNYGDMILLGAPLCWAAYSVLSKKVMGKMSPLAATTYACTMGTLMLAPFALREQLQAGWQVVNLNYQGWLSIIYMAVFASVLGFVWWNQGIAKIGASKTSIFVNMVPLSNLVLASVILSEKVIPAQLAGAALVIAGVYLSSRKPAEQKKKILAEVS